MAASKYRLGIAPHLGTLGAIALLYWAINAPAMAQLTRPLPAQPQLVDPFPAGTTEAQYTVPKTVVVQWKQMLATSSGSVNPGYFVICVQAPAVNCSWQAHSPSSGVWSGSATSALFSRTEILGPKPVSGSPALLGYVYRATLVLGNSFFDRALKWTIGACTSTSTSTCTFAPAPGAKPATNYYSTRNVRPDGFTIVFWSGPFGTDQRLVQVNSLAGNYGTTDVGPFSSEVIGMKALVNPNNTAVCETDPNRPGLNLPDTALLATVDGRLLTAGSLRSVSGGPINYSGPPIVGISREGPSFAEGLVPSSAERFLSVGETGEPVSDHLVRVVAASQPIPPAGSVVGILAVAKADYSGLAPSSDPARSNRIVEFDETDNTRIRCTVMFF